MDFDTLFKQNWDLTGLYEAYPQFKNIYCRHLKPHDKPIALSEIVMASILEKKDNYFYRNNVVWDEKNPVDSSDKIKLINVFIQQVSPLDLFNSQVLEVKIKYNALNHESQSYSFILKGYTFYRLFKMKLSDSDFSRKVEEFREFARILKTRNLVNVLKFLEKHKRNPFHLQEVFFAFKESDTTPAALAFERYQKTINIFKQLKDNQEETSFHNFKKEVS